MSDSDTQDSEHGLDVVVVRVASFRIDPKVIRRPGCRLVLIATESKRDYLVTSGAAEAFDNVIYLNDAFDVNELVSTVESQMGKVPTKSVRLLCHDEYALQAAAQVRQELGLRGPQPREIRPFTDKAEMKRHVGRAGLRVPRYTEFDTEAYRQNPHQVVDDLVTDLGMPVFVKPTGESGGVGAERLDNRDELAVWAERASSVDATGNTTAYEVDEFISGTLYHVDTLVSGGNVIYTRCNRYLFPLAQYPEGKVCSSYTLADDDPECARLLEFNAAVIDAFDQRPRVGAFHHEMFVTAEGEVVFLEIAARAPAALVPQTGQIRSGVNIEEAHFKLLQGEPVRVPEPQGPYAGFIYYPRSSGVVTGVADAPPVSSTMVWSPAVVEGEVTERSQDVRDFAVAALIWNVDLDALRVDMATLAELNPVTVATSPAEDRLTTS